MEDRPIPECFVIWKKMVTIKTARITDQIKTSIQRSEIVNPKGCNYFEFSEKKKSCLNAKFSFIKPDTMAADLFSILSDTSKDHFVSFAYTFYAHTVYNNIA